MLVAALCVAVGVATLTLTKSKLFRPWRDLCSRGPGWWGTLWSCHYCLAHWLAGLAVWATGGAWAFTGTPVLDWLVTTLCVIAGSMVVATVVFVLVKGIPQQ